MQEKKEKESKDPCIHAWNEKKDQRKTFSRVASERSDFGIQETEEKRGNNSRRGGRTKNF
jgi:hypothetical protein